MLKNINLENAGITHSDDLTVDIVAEDCWRGSGWGDGVMVIGIKVGT